MRGTYILSSIEGGISQNTKRKPASKGHLHPVEHRGRDKLRTPKEDQRGTYSLLSTEGEISQGH